MLLLPAGSFMHAFILLSKLQLSIDVRLSTDTPADCFKASAKASILKGRAAR